MTHIVFLTFFNKKKKQQNYDLNILGAASWASAIGHKDLI